MNRAEKETFVSEMTKRLSAANAVFLGDFRGVSVAQSTQLRGALRKAGVEIRVVKNTLFRRAVEASPFAGRIDEAMYVGPNAVMIVADLVGGARALRDWLKENDTVTFVVKGGALPTGALTAAEIKALAALPTREELLATFMAQLRSPLVKFATLLNAPLRDFANAIKALESKKSSS